MEAYFTKGILPAITLDDEKKAIKVAEAIFSGGLDLMEVAFRTQEAAACIQSINREFPHLIIGAGTLLTIEQLHQAIDSGAKFGLAPGFNPRVVKEAIKLDFPFIPGVMSPSEIEGALELGCKILKLFPSAQIGGIEMLRALHGPYGHTGIQFIPMGGVNLHNMKEFLAEPNVIAIGGSWLAHRELIHEKNYDAIRKNTLEAMKMVAS